MTTSGPDFERFQREVAHAAKRAERRAFLIGLAARVQRFAAEQEAGALFEQARLLNDPARLDMARARLMLARSDYAEPAPLAGVLMEQAELLERAAERFRLEALTAARLTLNYERTQDQLAKVKAAPCGVPHPGRDCSGNPTKE